MKIIHVNTINKSLREQALFMRECDKSYTDSLRAAAERIADERREKPIILLSGPSGSGKTTSALKIEEMLDSRGISTHTISMDDYFLPAGEFENVIGEDGKPDYESPMRIDIKKLNNHMELICACEEVVVPSFEFSSQSTRDGFTLKRGKDDIVVFEGIHALNPLVTGAAGAFAQCMYVSVRSRVQLSDSRLIDPALIRLMRRIVRDELYRGRLAAQTIEMFKSVERGENRYIMPYKKRAEQQPAFSIDTFIPYEPAVYKTLLDEKLKGLEGSVDFPKLYDMLELFNQIEAADLSSVANDSLVREFIGGSRYEY